MTFILEQSLTLGSPAAVTGDDGHDAEAWVKVCMVLAHFSSCCGQVQGSYALGALLARTCSGTGSIESCCRAVMPFRQAEGHCSVLG